MPDALITRNATAEVIVPRRSDIILQAPAQRDLSVQARDVMGRTPAWILRSGVTALACLLLVVLFLSWLIHYPDTIKGVITVSGTSPAVPLVAKQGGNVERLHVAEGDLVKAGQLLAVVKNSANSTQVLAVKAEVAKLQPFLADPSRFVTMELNPDLQLGPVQNSYSDFATSYRNYETLLSDPFTEKTIAIVKNQLVIKRGELESTMKQKDSADRELDIGLKSLERMRRLHQGGAATLGEVQTLERGFLAQDRQVSALGKAVLEDQIVINDYEKQLSQLAHQREETLRLARLTLSEAVKKLAATIESWESEYVLRSPIEGKVSFYEFWREQQYVMAGKTVMVIVPEVNAIVGRMPTKAGGAGKVMPGQKVFIELSDYPAREFGMVVGTVQSVSLVVQQGEQLVSVKIDYPLKTHLHRAVAFKQDMTGNASIVTQDYRIIERVFHSFLDALQSTKNKGADPPKTSA